jgi:hypothetical protein
MRTANLDTLFPLEIERLGKGGLKVYHFNPPKMAEVFAVEASCGSLMLVE